MLNPLVKFDEKHDRDVKETSAHILCECPVLEKVRMQTWVFPG